MTTASATATVERNVGLRGGSAVELEPESVLPSQYFSQAAVDASLQPEKRLMLAVLEDAVGTFQKYVNARDRSAQKLFAEVEDWYVRGSGLAVLLREHQSCSRPRCGLPTPWPGTLAGSAAQPCRGFKQRGPVPLPSRERFASHDHRPRDGDEAERVNRTPHRVAAASLRSAAALQYSRRSRPRAPCEQPRAAARTSTGEAGGAAHRGGGWRPRGRRRARSAAALDSAHLRPAWGAPPDARHRLLRERHSGGAQPRDRHLDRRRRHQAAGGPGRRSLRHRGH